MKTAKKDKQIFLVLVPHRDIRLKLHKFSGLLYKNGVLPAYSFPLAAPLASLSRQLNEDELKNFARSFRETAEKGMFNITEASTCSFPDNKEMILFGQRLEIKYPDLFTRYAAKINYLFSSPIIGFCLMPKARKQKISASAPLWENHKFRAAAIANMFWKPVKLDGETCYKWKIGKLSWLPK